MSRARAWVRDGDGRVEVVDRQTRRPTLADGGRQGRRAGAGEIVGCRP